MGEEKENKGIIILDKRKQDTLPTRDSCQTERHARIASKGMGKDIS